jgi:hypothetical protein
MQYSWIFLTINYDYLQKSLQLAYKNKRTRGQEDKKQEPLRVAKRLLRILLLYNYSELSRML